jgi:tetratricopeptide (TPR) repeat protein
MQSHSMRTRSRALGALLVVVLALLAGCGGPQSRFASHMQRGQSYYDHGDFVHANVEFRNALQIAPKNANAAIMVARTAEKLGRVRDAFALYQFVVDRMPDNTEARASLGRLLVMGGAAKQALGIIEPGIAKHPEDAALLSSRAFARLHLKEPDKAGALADIEQALRIAPNSEEVVSLRAAMYRDAGDFAGGAAFVSAALKAHPDSTDLHQILASLYRDSGDTPRAEEQLQDLIRLKPKDPQARYGLAEFYADTHRTDDAQHVLDQAVQDLGGDDARLRLVSFLTQQRSPAEGERKLRDFVAHDPNNSDLRLALGELLERSNNVKGATEVYQQLIAREGTAPNGLIARDRIAHIAFRENRYADAGKLVDEVLRENGHDDEALAIRGQIAFARHDLPAAVADFRAVLRDQPQAADVSSLLARAYAANQQTTLAEETLRKGLQLAPGDLTLLLDFSQLLLQSGRADEDVTLLEDAIRNAPKDPFLRQSLVRAYLAKRDYAGAYTTSIALQTLRPDSPTGYFNAGLAAQGQNQLDEAQKQYTHALALRPQAVDALTALSQLYVSRGRADQAVKLLNDAFERDKTNPFPVNLLGELYLEQKDIPHATAAFTQASQVAPNWWPPYRNLALAHEAAGDSAGAIAAYNAGIQAAPSIAKLPIELAALYESNGRSQDAIGCYEAWLKKNPGSQLIANNLAMLLVTYRTDAASLDRARDLTAPFSASNDGNLLDTRGWVYLKRAEYAQALPVLERAAERAPESREVRYHLAIAELHSGQTDRARSNLESALAGSVKFSGSDDARSQLAALNHNT